MRLLKRPSTWLLLFAAYLIASGLAKDRNGMPHLHAGLLSLATGILLAIITITTITLGAILDRIQQSMSGKRKEEQINRSKIGQNSGGQQGSEGTSPR
jgi:hypothetical protein